MPVAALILGGAAGFVAGRYWFPVQVAVAPPAKPPEGPPEKPAERLSLTAVGFAELPGWNGDDQAAALPAFQRSCAKLDGPPLDRPFDADIRQAGTAAEWRAICAAIPASTPAAAARGFFERWFQPYRAAGKDGPAGLFTGYYEPELRGARQMGGRFTVPLYAPPADLVQIDLGQFAPDLKGRSIAGRVEGGRLRPYPDRARIENGHLEGQGAELLWVDDAVDAFFLQVQGSGRVVLPQGGAVRVGFAGHNGLGYVPIGRLLIEGGKIPREQMSMQAIRDWLRANPGEAVELMRRNPRYVFFREIAGDGPLGAQGVALTPGRSIAVDRRYVPLGVPLWLDTATPDGRPLRRLMLAQDAGGAIQGPVRGDIFFGAGEAALAEAGAMQSPGSWYLLLPKAAAD
ncbi:MAG: murein transglycosylase A [Rhodospirillales bacterium]